MTEADSSGPPAQRFVHYLEMATRAYEASRSPNADIQIRNLYVWVAKSWEMLAMDELDKLRSTERAKTRERGRANPRPRAHARDNSHAH